MKLINEISGPNLRERILLKDRDYRLLRVMSEQQVLSMLQIRKYFFDGLSDSPAYRRMRKMLSYGLVRQLQLVSESGASLWSTTPLGRSYGLRGCHYNVCPLSSLNPKELEHTLELTDCRFQIEKLWSGIFYPESTIGERRWTHKPDGVFQFPDNRLLPIELERSNKGYERLKKILGIWEETKGIQHVLYIALNEELKRVVLNTARQGSPQYKVIVTTIENLAEVSPEGETLRGPIKLKSLAGTHEH